MATAKIELPPKLVPVFEGSARYRGAYGGRGSGKTRSFAKMSAVIGYAKGMEGKDGQILCTREHLNSLDDSSMEEVKTAIRSEPFLNAYYEIGEKFIRSRDGRIRYTFAGLRHNIDSIKSKANILLNWTDEAEKVTEESWRKLIPTVREANSEIWATWNPESKRSSTHLRFRESPPRNSKIIALNWRDNPWFPDVLEQERQDDHDKRPHIYDHVWEGDFLQAYEGAYYAASLHQAGREGRIGKVARDPLLPLFAIWDIGGTGRLSDATAIWVVQFIGQEVRALNYYEAQGQELSAHVHWLRDTGYEKAICILPHDGATKDKVYRVSFQSSLEQAGFTVEVVPNQGAGAAKLRVEAARRIFPACWFAEDKTEAGREALAHYHEKIDEDRGIGLGPEHDWSSHGSDAFGLMAVYYEGRGRPKKKRPPRRRATGWAA